VVTDPPYGIALENHGMVRSNGWSRVEGDIDTAAVEFVLVWAASLVVPTVVFASPWKPWPGRWRNLIVWDKGGAAGGGGDTAVCLKRTWELIQVARNGPIGARQESVWAHSSTPAMMSLHPTQKPESLMLRLIETFTKRDAVVCDPFMGSGTTLLAGKRLGRKVIGIELDERYCEIAARRLQQDALPLEVA